jgi:hypothetical protein
MALSNWMSRLTFSLVFAALSMFLIGQLDQWISYSETRDAITDTLRYPGGIVAGLFYTQGIHTGGGTSGWATAALWANFVFYTSFWFLVLTITGNLRKRR